MNQLYIILKPLLDEAGYYEHSYWTNPEDAWANLNLLNDTHKQNVLQYSMKIVTLNQLDNRVQYIHEVIRLSDEEAAIFMKYCENPPEPNQALKDLFKKK